MNPLYFSNLSGENEINKQLQEDNARRTKPTREPAQGEKAQRDDSRGAARGSSDTETEIVPDNEGSIQKSSNEVSDDYQSPPNTIGSQIQS